MERVAQYRAWRRPAVRSLLVHVAYFLALSCAGYGLLSAIEARGPRPRAIDAFFTAVSAATVSSMSAVEMEVFSQGQLVVLTVLMFLGGEVFVSLVGLASKWSRLRKHTINRARRVGSHEGEIELGRRKTSSDVFVDEASLTAVNAGGDVSSNPVTMAAVDAKRLRSLFFIVLGILGVVHVAGSVAVAGYIYASPGGARRTLRGKSLDVWTFAVFTTVSTFSSCGFMPTNENMAVFSRDAPLQLLLVPQALVGNTLFPPLLAACVWATRQEELLEMMMSNNNKQGGRREVYYYHLMPARRCWMLAATVVAFVGVQVAMVCGMEWDGAAFRGMTAWEKLVNAVFLAVNSRHTGESTVDLSTLAPAILVLFVVMMYLPPYATWFPFEDNSTITDYPSESQGIRLLKTTVLSQLSYLAIFVIAVCITERKKLKDDPLNFNVLSIIVEVVSAYGNVGFSMGYSCSRRINSDQLCTDKWTGFAGRWSGSGKLILILVMFFGRLKKFSMKGGKGWKLN
ncbi:hypothetical protein QOZ80_4AG0304700 [Eleusine coracana subsp. coracana]|nr:hypothetical protein QOZ80_4AG0304700 [Eleusine coracana subsp. coracana]